MGKQRTEKRTRKLKIAYHYYENNSVVPSIKLLGKWLNDFGFNIGEQVEVYSEHLGELTIRKANNNI